MTGPALDSGLQAGMTKGVVLDSGASRNDPVSSTGQAGSKSGLRPAGAGRRGDPRAGVLSPAVPACAYRYCGYRLMGASQRRRKVRRAARHRRICDPVRRQRLTVLPEPCEPDVIQMWFWQMGRGHGLAAFTRRYSIANECAVRQGLGCHRVAFRCRRFIWAGGVAGAVGAIRRRPYKRKPPNTERYLRSHQGKRILHNPRKFILAVTLGASSGYNRCKIDD